MDFEEEPAPTEDVAEPEEKTQSEDPAPATLPTDSDDLFSTPGEDSGTAVLEPSAADEAPKEETEEEVVKSKPVAPAPTKTVDLFDDDIEEEPPAPRPQPATVAAPKVRKHLYSYWRVA